MRVSCRRLFIGLLLAGMTFMPPSTVRAAPDDAGPLLDAVHAAFADGRLEQSRLLGFDNPKKQFREAPEDGGVLTAFDLGLGKWFNVENIYAVRAVYLTKKGDVRLQEHGLFRDKSLANGKVLKTKVVRTLHIQAPAGYAVGGLTVRSGLNINGLAVTFMKIDGNALDPTQGAVSEWIGDRIGGSESSIDGNGAPVVGLFGSQDDEHVSALGLIYAAPPTAAVAPPVAVHRAEPPPAPPPAAQPPRQDVAEKVPEAAPWEIPHDPVSAEPTVTPKKTVAPASTGWPLWAAVGIPVAAFGAVAGVCCLALLIPSGRKAPQARSAPARKPAARPTTAAAESPSALCTAPRQAPRKRPVVEEQEVMELREEDFLPLEETLLEVLPVEPSARKTAAATESAPPASGSWPRLEV